MNDATKAVAVTGASGYIGTQLLSKLEDEEGIRKLVAIDTKPPPAPIHNMAVYRRDVTEPIDDILTQHHVSTLVHLAFVTRRGRNRREVSSIRQANLDSLKAVLESCVRARVNHIIYLSSHTVYGAHPDNPIPLTDGASLRPAPDFPYGYDKYLSELVLQEFAAEHQDVAVTVLRSCIVLGPLADNYITRAFFRPLLLGVLDYNPPLQFVYEGDLSRVLALVIQRGLPGIFNVAGDGVVFYKEVAEIIHSRFFSLPSFLAYPLVQLTWNLRIQRDSTACGLDLVRYPIVVSTGKLNQATGYRFWHTSLEALTAFANSSLLYKEPA
ncbi:MAG: NAD-dependent epimerase/dehydratase family protein [Chloroflexi bacterium]|nr:NAD-dependent epimerase/dehydratase family protein [Chloroflexota bacterium]